MGVKSSGPAAHGKRALQERVAVSNVRISNLVEPAKGSRLSFKKQVTCRQKSAGGWNGF